MGNPGKRFTCKKGGKKGPFFYFLSGMGLCTLKKRDFCPFTFIFMCISVVWGEFWCFCDVTCTCGAPNGLGGTILDAVLGLTETKRV